jgi:hypothetical protein
MFHPDVVQFFNGQEQALSKMFKRYCSMMSCSSMGMGAASGARVGGARSGGAGLHSLAAEQAELAEQAEQHHHLDVHGWTEFARDYGIIPTLLPQVRERRERSGAAVSG